MHKLHSTTRKLALTIATTVLLVACAVPPPVPEDHYYYLPEAKLEKSAPLVKELAVKRFVADGLHSERALLFSKAGKSLRLKQYHYHHWTDIPPRMLQEHMITALRNAGAANMVINHDPVNRSKYTLSGKIRHFEQYASGQASEIRINIELRLDDEHGKPILLKDYRRIQSAESTAPHDLVTAFGLALADIYREFLNDWRKQQ